METNCTPLIADLFLYCNESQFIVKFPKRPFLKITYQFIQQLMQIDDILPVNNPNFLTFVIPIYPKELTLYKANITSDSCQVLHLDKSPFHGKFNTRIYDKADDFSLFIATFRFVPSYGVYISQFVHCPRICDNVSDFIVRNLVI